MLSAWRPSEGGTYLQTILVSPGTFVCSEGSCDVTTMYSVSSLFFPARVMCSANDLSCVQSGQHQKRIVEAGIEMPILIPGHRFEPITFTGLTFRDGESTHGGGMLMHHKAKVILEVCLFVNNAATLTNMGGGAIYAGKKSSIMI